MKIINFALPCLLVLAGCSTPSQPEAPKPPQIGMANPASVYCQQKGGTLIPGNDSNLLIVFYVQIMPDDFVMQLHRF